MTSTNQTEVKVSTNPVKEEGGGVYVGDLDININEATLFEYFQPIGAIVSVRICRDAITRQSLGYGYVNYTLAKDAKEAIEKKNCTKLGSKFIRVMPVFRDAKVRKNAAGNVFIKNLNGDINTQTLHDMFLAMGTILSCKVVVDDNGNSKGYGFVHFAKEDDAKTAIASFNGKTMKELQLYVAPFVRRNIRIQQMIANFTNVYIKNVLPNVTDNEIKKFFQQFGSITSTCTRKDKQGRIFGFCNFASHKEAANAIENLHDKHIDGLADNSLTLYVQRAQKKSERMFEITSKSRFGGLGDGNNLYVKNFGQLDSAKLREIFGAFGEIKSLYFPQDEQGNSRGFGFVCFATAEGASRALRELDGRIINDLPLYVNVAQKRETRHNLLQLQFQRQPTFSSNAIRGFAQQFLQMSNPYMGMNNYGYQYPQQQQHGNFRNRNNRSGPRRQTGQQGPPVQTVVGTIQQPASRTTTPSILPKSRPPANPLTPSLGPVSLEEIKKMPKEEQMNALGERLYARIAEIDAEHAPKITGMLLEIETADLVAMLNSPEELTFRVKEARDVLLNYNREGN